MKGSIYKMLQNDTDSTEQMGDVRLYRLSHKLQEMRNIGRFAVADQTGRKRFCLSVTWFYFSFTKAFILLQLLFWWEGFGPTAAGLVRWVHPDVCSEDCRRCATHRPAGRSSAHVRRGGGTGEQTGDVVKHRLRWSLTLALEATMRPSSEVFQPEWVSVFGVNI